MTAITTTDHENRPLKAIPYPVALSLLVHRNVRSGKLAYDRPTGY